MSYLFPITSTTELGVTQVGSGINVSNGIISVQNIQGIQGVQGTQGTQAAQGVQGRQGIQGNQGTQGTQSTQGTQGTQGTQAAQGTQGIQGQQGTQGIQGRQGTQAAQGTQGIQGVQGIQGTQSNQGTQGIQGTQSNQGIQGIQGTGGSGGGATIGTWTPTIAVSTAGTITLTVNTANYAKMGQQVICYFDITVATKSGGSNTNTLTMNGLPFTSVAGSGVVGSLVVTIFENLNVNNSYVSGTIAGSSTSVSLYSIHNAADNTRLTYTEVQAGSSPTRFVGTITYISAS